MRTTLCSSIDIHFKEPHKDGSTIHPSVILIAEAGKSIVVTSEDGFLIVMLSSRAERRYALDTIRAIYLMPPPRHPLQNDLKQYGSL